jgi:hypothetical protein
VPEIPVSLKAQPELGVCRGAFLRQHVTRLVVVNHLHIDRILSLPTENDAPLSIDPQAPEASPITFQFLQPVTPGKSYIDTQLKPRTILGVSHVLTRLAGISHPRARNGRISWGSGISVASGRRFEPPDYCEKNQSIKSASCFPTKREADYFF